MSKLLVVEDDADIRDILKSWLEKESFSVDCLPDGSEFLERINSYSYDLIVLDWNLPGKTGVELCSAYRAQKGMLPVIMLTGRDQVEEKTFGLDSGADDYLTKPFHPRELTSRIRALLRRPGLVAPPTVNVGGLRLDAARKVLQFNDNEVELLPKEFAIFEFLARFPDSYFSAEAIVERVWSSESESSPDTVRVHITRLRKKLAGLGCGDRIVTMHGFGYKLTSS